MNDTQTGSTDDADSPQRSPKPSAKQAKGGGRKAEQRGGVLYEYFKETLESEYYRNLLDKQR
jgi:hypothetical protein